MDMELDQREISHIDRARIVTPSHQRLINLDTDHESDVSSRVSRSTLTHYVGTNRQRNISNLTPFSLEKVEGLMVKHVPNLSGRSKPCS